MRYTYRFTKPAVAPPFKTVIRFTRGTFDRITPPCGAFEFSYAVFRNKASEVWIPLHDLTTETRKAIHA